MSLILLGLLLKLMESSCGKIMAKIGYVIIGIGIIGALFSL